MLSQYLFRIRGVPEIFGYICINLSVTEDFLMLDVKKPKI